LKIIPTFLNNFRNYQFTDWNF